MPGPNRNQSSTHRNFLAEAIRREEARLAALEHERHAVQARLDGLCREQNGLVIGIPAAGPDDDEDNRTPWTRSPSRKLQRPEIPGPLPTAVRVVVFSRIFVEKTRLPSALLNQIKRLAAFQNPEFYKKQNLRLSTALTPRVIACAEEFSEHLALPRGCLGDLEALLGEHEIAVVIGGHHRAIDIDGEALDSQALDGRGHKLRIEPLQPFQMPRAKVR